MKRDIKRTQYQAKLIKHGGGPEVNVKVDIIQYVEDGIIYAACPALDLTGYGLTDSEARHSLEISILEYIKYTMHKGTLKQDLIALGWKQHKKNNFVAPSLIDIANMQEELKDLLNTVPYQKTSRNIELPAFA